MKILLLSSAFSGLTQRFYTELNDAGYDVSVELHHGDNDLLLEGITLFKPDLIICPFLTKRIPAEIYQNYTCLIVHPGIKGDRGPSSLDWAIQNGEAEWGVSLLEAREEMDSGDIWSNKTFPMRIATKGSLFNREVTQAAIDCLWEVLTFIDAPDFRSEPLDYSKPDFKGQLLPMMKQADRAINWKKHSTIEILNRINAADGSPGVLDKLYDMPVYLYNAHREHTLKGKAGTIIATANQAVCLATIDGALWIGHLKQKMESAEKTIKLPATEVLKDLLPQNSNSVKKGFFTKSIPNIEIDYTIPGQQLPCQEAWYELDGDIALVYWSFHNGAMTTEQLRLLLSVYQHVAALPGKAIILMGSEDFWSNGIHLNHIENASNSAEESWLNINAIDDLILQIITTLDKVTISAVAANPGAGGAILALASDLVFAREGIVFNPHYKNMGGLFGSEYWTYLLPKRVGHKTATQLTEQRLPISAKNAWKIGFVDRVLDKNHQLFAEQVKHLASLEITDAALSQRLNEKAKTRCFDEAKKPLSAYRKYELIQMYENFYGNDAYHKARHNFVYKVSDSKTPENIAPHRQKNERAALLLS